MSSLPTIFSTQEDELFISSLEQRVKSDPTVKDSDLILKYPIVYIHYWQTKLCSYIDKKGVTHNWWKYNIYVGESIDVLQRTREHYDAGRSASAWQSQLVNAVHTPQFIAIGHEHFNKSFTLDIENRLIEYVLAMGRTVDKSYNSRGNPQNCYYPSLEFDRIFSNIWRRLRKQNSELFVSESEIRNSALFKASPLKKLTAEQSSAKENIIERVLNAYRTDKDGQLIIVQGEAGTGKTVLTTSTFYELMTRHEADDSFPILSCSLLVNHDQQAKVYEGMMSRLGFPEDSAGKPTKFINGHLTSKKVDVALIDEGHLLWTQGKQSYRGSNQLRDIIARAKVTVLMFDEYQVLNTEQYWEPHILEYFKDLSKKQGNYIKLGRQLRMECSQSTMDWINELVLNQNLVAFPPDKTDYEVKAFDSPQELQEAIEKRASSSGTELSRLVATYDWEYKKNTIPDSKPCWNVEVGSWNMPWNYELERNLAPKQRKAIKHLAWAEQPHTIGEVGSTYTIQGFDLSYVGVILGPSVKYRGGKIVFDSTASKNDKATRNRTLADNTTANFGGIFIRNEVKVLLGRGVKGLYIYACDDELRHALKTVAKI